MNRDEYMRCKGGVDMIESIIEGVAKAGVDNISLSFLLTELVGVKEEIAEDMKEYKDVE